MLSWPSTMAKKNMHSATQTSLATAEDLLQTLQTGLAGSSPSPAVAVDTWARLRTRAHDWHRRLYLVTDQGLHPKNMIVIPIQCLSMAHKG